MGQLSAIGCWSRQRFVRPLAPFLVCGAIVLTCGSRTGLLSTDQSPMPRSIARRSTSPRTPAEKRAAARVVDSTRPTATRRTPASCANVGHARSSAAPRACFEGNAATRVGTLGRTSSSCQFTPRWTSPTKPSASLRRLHKSTSGHRRTRAHQVDRNGATLPRAVRAHPDRHRHRHHVRAYNAQAGLAKDQVAVRFLARPRGRGRSADEPRRLARCERLTNGRRRRRHPGTGKGKSFHQDQRRSSPTTCSPTARGARASRARAAPDERLGNVARTPTARPRSSRPRAGPMMVLADRRHHGPHRRR